MTWQIELVRRYPLLFRTQDSEHAAGYPAVGDGWQLIVEKAIGRIDTAASALLKAGTASIRIAQIKEKLGGLRIYADWTALPEDAAAKVQEAIDLAQARSYCTCETCGAPGQLHDDGGWYTTCCDRHAKGEPIEPKHDDPDLHIQYTFVGGKMRVIKCRRYDREHDAFVDAPLPPGEQWAEEK